jgi:hypothetical protein
MITAAAAAAAAALVVGLSCLWWTVKQLRKSPAIPAAADG